MVVPVMLLFILFVLLLLALLLAIAAAALAIVMAVAVATAVALIARGLFFSCSARPALATAARARAVLAMGKRRAASGGAAPGAPDDSVDLSERGSLPARRLRARRAQHPPRA